MQITHEVARSKYDSSIETTNFARLIRIILGPCSDVLRAVLKKEMLPSNLSTELKSVLFSYPNYKNMINKRKQNLVYDKDYSQFDIPLLYFLFSKVTKICEHHRKWGNEPTPEDTTVSANIERIVLIRDTYIVHARGIGIPDSEFEKLWKKLVLIVKRLEGGIRRSTVYQDAVTRLKSCSMDPDVNNDKENLQGLLKNKMVIIQLLKYLDINDDCYEYNVSYYFCYWLMQMEKKKLTKETTKKRTLNNDHQM